MSLTLTEVRDVRAWFHAEEPEGGELMLEDRYFVSEENFLLRRVAVCTFSLNTLVGLLSHCYAELKDTDFGRVKKDKRSSDILLNTNDLFSGREVRFSDEAPRAFFCSGRRCVSSSEYGECRAV